jgi:hypothetical protein
MSNFMEKWGFVNSVRDKLIEDCPILCLEHTFELVNRFISGRDRYICTFTLDGNVFSRHVAMKMTSKYGNEYFLVEYEPMGVPSGKTISRNTRNARVRKFISENPDFLSSDMHDSHDLDTEFCMSLNV